MYEVRVCSKIYFVVLCASVLKRARFERKSRYKVNAHARPLKIKRYSETISTLERTDTPKQSFVSVTSVTLSCVTPFKRTSK